MNKNLSSTLKAWPVIAIATIGLCYLTQGIAKLFGIDLPDQEQITMVRNYLFHAFDSVQHFTVVASLLLQVLVLAPTLEEPLFRWLLFMLPVQLTNRLLGKGRETGDEGRGQRHVRRGVEVLVLLVSSAAFSAIHYVDFAALAKDGGFKWLPLSSAFIALFFFGLAQCWLYRKTERLWCPMLNHFLFNLTNVVLIFLVPG